MDKVKNAVLSKKGTVAVTVSGALTAAVSLVMNLVLIPKIEATTNGIRCFDMNFAYSFETAKEFLSLLSDAGRSLYLTVQLPLDFVYPVAYTLFFCMLIIRLTKKANALLVLPALLAVFDYCENVCTIIMLKSAELSKPLATAGSIFTSVKTVLMYLVFAVIIVCIVRWCINKKRSAK